MNPSWLVGLTCGMSALACSAGGGSKTNGEPSTGSGGYVGSPTGGGGGGAFTAAGGGIDIVTLGSGGSPSVVMPDASSPSDQPIQIDECLPVNPAGIDSTAVQALEAGSGSAGSLRILNPYDGTVFPRGLIAPLLMWDGGSADLVYVHIKSSNFEYKGCFKPTGTNQLQLPQAIWDQAAAKTNGRSDPYSLQLTISSGGTATGPVSESVIIAQANLKGTIYYNSYSSALAGGSGGAVLRMTPGKPAEAFLGQSGCTGCHSVSANGSRMVALPFLTGGATYALTPGGPTNPAPLAPTAPNTFFTGVYPDGSLYLSNANFGNILTGITGPRAGGPGAVGPSSASLYVTDTGTVVPNSGIPPGVMTPMFSPDGTLLAFNDYAINDGHGLAVMNFDKSSRTANGYKQVYQTPDTTKFPGWPFFLPDNQALIFANGTASDFSGEAIGLAGGGLATVSSDVYVVDVAGGTPSMLANAMGYRSEQDASSSTTYLPFGAEELHHNFYPTGSPVAAGGYFWVFFDSYRHYGNTHDNGLIRQLWGAAVDISPNGTYSGDPSHPAFYLTGQEDVAGNHRAFTALDPCQQDGATCTTGIDCCGGFCTNGVCGKPPPATGPVCANTDESCAGGTPCCIPTDRCISGFCGQILH